MRGTGVERSGAGAKILVAMTVIGTVAIVVAITFFSLTGPGFGADPSRGIAGSVLDMTTVLLLTRSPRSGRRIAALVLLISFVGSLAFLLLQIACYTPASKKEALGPGSWAPFLASPLALRWHA
jgi:hypothetical protein